MNIYLYSIYLGSVSTSSNKNSRYMERGSILMKIFKIMRLSDIEQQPQQQQLQIKQYTALNQDGGTKPTVT